MVRISQVLLVLLGKALNHNCLVLFLILRTFLPLERAMPFSVSIKKFLDAVLILL